MSGRIPDAEYRDLSERAIRCRQKAEGFRQLASIELQPRARAQLLGLAAEYDQLAEMRLPETGPGSLLLVGVKVG